MVGILVSFQDGLLSGAKMLVLVELRRTKKKKSPVNLWNFSADAAPPNLAFHWSVSEPSVVHRGAGQWRGRCDFFGDGKCSKLAMMVGKTI